MDIKKDFQNTIKAIRTDRVAEFNNYRTMPKPMMTKVQMEKNEATVNCGGEWGDKESTKAIADYTMNDKRFAEFLARHNATANLEFNQFGTYQIRLHF